MHTTIQTQPPIVSQLPVAVVIASCDRYSDLWGPFITLWWRYWPKCPFPVYFITNETQAKFAGVRPMIVGPDLSWSTTLKRGLLLIPEQYVLLFLDDLFLTESVATAALEHLVERAVRSRMNCLRFHPDPWPNVRIDHDVGLVAPGGAYRASTVLTLWDRAVLIELLREGESAWEFEIRGSERADVYSEFYATYRPWIKVTNGVIKGRWRPNVVRWLLKEGIAVDLGRRAVMSRVEWIRFILLDCRHRVFNLVPAPWRRRLRKFMHGSTYDSVVLDGANTPPRNGGPTPGKA